MTAVRQDAWTPENDLVLAEVTLKCIRIGSTQLAAFEEVGQKLGRTAAACGFRWNSWLRKQYQVDIQMAELERQKRNHLSLDDSESHNPPSIPIASEDQQSLANIENDTSSQSPVRTPALEEQLSFEVVIRFLRNQKEVHKKNRLLTKELAEKTSELESLRVENQKLKAELNSIQNDYSVVNNDYKALIQIMDRARKMAFLADEAEDERKTRFVRESNGNLERAE